MKENKFTTYVLYALGEIILVVVGILIAISIDNLNERNKELERERKVIESLKQEFEENLILLEFDSERLGNVIASCEYLYNSIGPDYEHGSINVDSVLSLTFSFPVWDPSNFVLDEIKNSGLLSSMTDSTLKATILDWEKYYSNLEDWHKFYEARSGKYFDYILANGNSKNINTYITNASFNQKSKFDRSNQEIMTKISFENHLSDKLVTSSFIYGWYQQTVPKIKNLIEACEKANSANN
ncbi:DUF6090 family protein [Ekhidna sp.]